MESPQTIKAAQKVVQRRFAGYSKQSALLEIITYSKTEAVRLANDLQLDSQGLTKAIIITKCWEYVRAYWPESEAV